MSRRRLDAELVKRGLASSRSQAQQLVNDGKVTIGGAPALNVARQVSPAEPIVVIGPPPKYVGRGGHKLEAALQYFAIDVTEKVAIDVGASTGGFTDCLLQHGASAVTALDVGHGQLHERLRADSRVTVLEKTNIRHVTIEALSTDLFDIAVVDVSFISLRTIAKPLLDLCRAGGDVIALIKPQFEAGRQEVSKGKGVIRERETWQLVLNDVVDAMNGLGAATMGLMVSPVVGAEGNVEFLGWFRVGSTAQGSYDLETVLDDAVALEGGSL